MNLVRELLCESLTSRNSLFKCQQAFSILPGNGVFDSVRGTLSAPGFGQIDVWDGFGEECVAAIQSNS